MALTTTNLVMLIEQARAALAECDALKKAAWDIAPGNLHMQHVFLNAHNYHTRWQHWNAARLDLLRLEQQYSDALASTEPPP